MKDQVFSILQAVGRSFMLPVAILPIAGKGGSDWGYAWVPVVGPLCGAAVAYIVAHVLGVV